MGYRLLCPPHVLDTVCQLWYRHRELPLPERLLVRHGMALTITITRSFQDELDVQNLLQLPQRAERQRLELAPLLPTPTSTLDDFTAVVALRHHLLGSQLGVVRGRDSR